MADRFFIGPFDAESGLNTSLRPWLIPESAFARLNNAYVFRGRVRKRFGSTFMVDDQLDSRLGITLGMTDGAGAAAGMVPGTIFGIGQMFSIGAQLFTVHATGAPAALLHTGAGTGTYNTTTGAYVFAGAPINTNIIFYPAQPVMGITQYEVGPVNDHPSYAFDTQFAYVFDGTKWTRSGTGIWHGTDSNFFWTTTWMGITANLQSMFVSNFNATIGAPGANDDPLWTFDGTTWATFTPQFLSSGAKVMTARLVIAFKNRVLLMNTIEQSGGTNTGYVNRCRFSQNGSPFEGGLPLCTTAWLEQTQAGSHGAGFIDATTEEAIISAEFIKDRLIVYFERSTWELAYTGNEVLPFVWQKINTELGSESEFSTVPFDKVVLTIGNSGVHACNSANVDRIDNSIPDQVFQIRNKNAGSARVAGIRDYFTEMVYWSIPSIDRNIDGTYPDRVLVYNYKNGTWSYNDDCITAFGYFEQQGDITWSNIDITWQEFEGTWGSGVTQSDFRQVIAGNQEGFVYRIIPTLNSNAHVMQITDIVTAGAGLDVVIMNHTLLAGEYIHIENAVGVTGVNDTIFMVFRVVDANTIFINNAAIVGTYRGGGIASRVSQVSILTKEYNFYVDKGVNAAIGKVDFYVTKTSGGAITIDYYPSSSSESMLYNGSESGALLGTGTLDTSPYALVPLEKVQDRIWHPLYLQTQGETIQFYMYFTDAQMVDPMVVFCPFELHGMVIYATPTSRLS